MADFNTWLMAFCGAYFAVLTIERYNVYLMRREHIASLRREEEEAARNFERASGISNKHEAITEMVRLMRPMQTFYAEGAECIPENIRFKGKTLGEASIDELREFAIDYWAYATKSAREWLLKAPSW